MCNGISLKLGNLDFLLNNLKLLYLFGIFTFLGIRGYDQSYYPSNLSMNSHPWVGWPTDDLIDLLWFDSNVRVMWLIIIGLGWRWIHIKNNITKRDIIWVSNGTVVNCLFEEFTRVYRVRALIKHRAKFFHLIWSGSLFNFILIRLVQIIDSTTDLIVYIANVKPEQ